MEDYGKEYLTYDKSVYVYQCNPTFVFSDESVTQLYYECDSGDWILNGKYSDCVPQGKKIMKRIKMNY